MNREQIIEGLRFTKEMFLLDPITNETMAKEQLNDMGRTTVDACEGAIEILQAIPSAESADILNEIQKEIKNIVNKPFYYPCDTISVGVVLKIIDKYKAIPSAEPYKGMTNGEVFLTVHPNVVAEIIKKKDNIFDVVQLRHKGDALPFAEIYIDWWNSPYSEGGDKE